VAKVSSTPRVKLYGFVLSHPVTVVRLALARKGIAFEQVNLTVGLHATQLRALGFPKGTVPAMKIDGQKIQGSRQIIRALEELQPEPRLFPADPSLRIAVEDAERWGEETLQPIPRRLFRYVASTDASVREAIARREGLPAPKMAARATAPRPELIFADEPTGNLDAATGEEIINLLFARRAETGATLLIITHDASLAARCERVLTMADGVIVSDTAAAAA
jgi:glutathione S-transferase